MSVEYNWIVDVDGLVYDKLMVKIGYFDTDGTVYTPDLGMKFGFVDINGDTYNLLDSIIGFVDVDGKIYDQYQKVIGFVNDDGIVYNSTQDPIGTVLNKIHHAIQKKAMKNQWRKTTFRAAAGIVLLLNKQ